MKGAITARAIEAAQRAIDGGDKPSATLRDDRVPGLALLIGKRTARWQLEYKTPLPGGGWSAGKRLALGDLDAMGVDAARGAALAAKRQIAEGIDPQAAKAARRTANIETGASQTLADAIARFCEEREGDWTAGTRRHFAGDFALLRAALGSAPLAMIERPALEELIADFLRAQRRAGHAGVRRAARIAELSGALWRQAAAGSHGRPGWGWPGVDPAIAASLPVAGKHRIASRKRTLSEAEIAAAWPALRDGLPGIGVGKAPRLALMISLATGLRCGAVALTRTADLHLDPERIIGARDSGPWIRLPAADGFKASAKDRREGADIHLPLSPFAARLWAEALALRPGSPFAFAGNAGKPMSPNTVSRAWRELADAPGSPIPADTTAHDLRRSMRTHLSELDHPGSFEDEERLLGHSIGSSVARVYDRGRRLARLRPLADAWGARLEAITGAPPAEVTALWGRARA